MSQLLCERYQLITRMKPGGTSMLWRALDLHTQQPVVLKFPNPPKLTLARERIQREAFAYRSLGSIQGMVSFIGYEDNPGHELGPFLALELLSGSSINERLLKQGPLPEPKVIVIARAVCNIVERLHRRGFVHRDLSSNNVLLLDGSGEVRLIDLGLALVPNKSKDGFEPHETGSVGTPTTRPPELSDVFSGDERSDVYSIGKVMYQMANGPEVSGQELPGLAPRAKSRVSEGLSEVIVRCVDASPNARYQSIQALDRALAKLQFKRRFKRVAVPVSQVCGVLLLAGAAYSFRQTKEASTPPEPTTRPVPMVAATQATPSSAPIVTEVTPTSAPTIKVTKKTKPPATKVVTQESNDDDEIEAAARANLLKLATEPTPIATPKPIEIRVVTEKK